MLSRRTFVPKTTSNNVVWIPNQPFACYALNVAHLVLPPGELWFCRLFNQVLPYIQDEELRQQTVGFIQQEGSHARSHKNVLESFEEQDLDFTKSKNRLNGIFETLLGDKVFGVLTVTGKMQFRWLRTRVGIVASIEHITCVLGNWVLENKGLAKAGADPTMLNLLKWHGAEEVEHRSVAYDLHRHLGGGAISRSILFVLALLVILLTWKRGTQVFIQQSDYEDKTRYGFKAYLRDSRLDLLPRVGFVFWNLLRFLKPGYHPKYEKGDALAKEVIESLREVVVK